MKELPYNKSDLLGHDHNNAPLFSFQRVSTSISPTFNQCIFSSWKGASSISLSPFLSLWSFWEISTGLLDFLKLHVLKLCRINVSLYSGRLVPHHSSSGGGSNNMNAGKDLLTVNSNASIEMQLRSRRKAAKMLVVVVIVFAVCYFPVHLVSILR